VPFQLVSLSPFLVPVWAIGWWRLLRSPGLARWPPFAIAYLVLAVLFIATGGKPYYLCGLYPVLLATGSSPVASWAAAGWARMAGLAAALAIGGLFNAYLFLPLVPASEVAGSPVEAINYDAGEQLGWPAFAATLTSVYDDLPAADRPRAVVLAGNYGEAGAVHRYAPDLPVSAATTASAPCGPRRTSTW